MVSFRRLDGSREIQSVNLACPVLHSNLKVPTPSIGEYPSNYHQNIFLKERKKDFCKVSRNVKAFLRKGIEC